MDARPLRDSSPFRKLDPRTRLIAAAGAAFCFSFIRDAGVSCLCLVFAIAFAAAGGPPPREMAKRLAAANVFIAFIWLTVPPAVPGEVIASLGPLAWTREGIGLALLVTLKGNAALIIFSALASSLGLPLVGSALERLGAPIKLVFLFLFTCRYIHVVMAEWRRLQTAARLRGFIPRNSLHTYRTVGNLLGLTLVNSIDRSRRICEAMSLRGFTGTFRTLAELRYTAADACFLPPFLLAAGGLLCLDLYRG